MSTFWTKLDAARTKKRRKKKVDGLFFRAKTRKRNSSKRRGKKKKRTSKIKKWFKVGLILIFVTLTIDIVVIDLFYISISSMNYSTQLVASFTNI